MVTRKETTNYEQKILSPPIHFKPIHDPFYFQSTRGKFT